MNLNTNIRKKSISSLLVLIVLIIISILVLKPQIHADDIIKKNTNPLGLINATIEFYDANLTPISINSDDISIYKESDLQISNGKYIIPTKTEQYKYSLYGTKIFMTTNIYITDSEAKQSLLDSAGYNVTIDNDKEYMVALTKDINVIPLSQYNNNITINKTTKAKKYNTIAQEEKIDTILDNFVIFINNQNIKDIIVKISFNRQFLISDTTYSYNKTAKVKYSLLNETNNISNIINNENNNLFDSINAEKIMANREQSDYSSTCIFSSPVNTYNEKYINNNIITYDVENGTKISSITDDGLVEIFENENIIKVSYTDKYYVLYKNIIPSVKNGDIVKSGEILGMVCPNSNIEILNVFDKHSELCEWMFSRFEIAKVGIPMPQMFQHDEEWGENSYGSSTIKTSGCGPSAFSMVLSYLKGEVYTPADVVSHMGEMGNGSYAWCYAPGQGSYHSIFERLSNEYGLSNEDCGLSEDAIKEKLEKGKIVIVCITKGKIYTSDGHFIVIRGVTEDGKFLINDSSCFFDLNTPYEYSDICPIVSARAIY